jgi:hypothetical protein
MHTTICPPAFAVASEQAQPLSAEARAALSTHSKAQDRKRRERSRAIIRYRETRKSRRIGWKANAK